MTNTVIIQHNYKLFAYSWTTGVVAAKIRYKIETDSQALAHALYLTRQGKSEEAEAFLDEYCK